MCGIIGYVGAFSAEQLTHANCAQAHRGPDADGIWFDHRASVGLAHTRLSIIDLSVNGNQPMIGEQKEIVLVFNGEIYNFRELREELVQKGYRFRGHSDTEVLLQLYVEYGAQMLPRLNGIFAMALWDGRTRSLLVARDAFGVKPLYYTEAAPGFAFASELKGLLQLYTVERTLDHEALHRYLSFLWCPGDATPLKSVHKLGPGEALTVRDARIRERWTWYQLPQFRPIQSRLDVRPSVEKTRASLRAAVQRQMVADVPVGAFLSGGLDSSSIVAFAREAASDIECFTIDAEGDGVDGFVNDLPYARLAAKHLGVALHSIRVEPGAMANDIEGMITQLDEPLADPAALNVLYISRLARQHGIKVLLSGAGGDDIFTGYRRHAALAYEPFWRWLPSPVIRTIRNASRNLDKRRPSFRRVGRIFDGAHLNGDERIANYFLWASESDLRGLYTPAMAKRVAAGSALAPMLDFLRPLPESIGPLERMLALEQRFFLTDHNLTYTDRMSMAAGVEVRVPFLDLDLVETAAQIPSRMKQRGLTGKWVLRKAMEGLLPREIIYRSKSGFGAPLRAWMRKELKPLVNDVLSPTAVRDRGLFDTAAVRTLLADNESGRKDAAYALLSLMSIELWCRTYVDRTVDAKQHRIGA
ncbi:MAG: asparagine synthase (glutamine-hydrolyzing) [Gemmatimonadaceae bacterium]